MKLTLNTGSGGEKRRGKRNEGAEGWAKLRASGGLLTGDHGGVAVLLLVALLLRAEAFHEARIALGHQLPGDTRGRGRGYIKQNWKTPTDLIKRPLPITACVSKTRRTPFDLRLLCDARKNKPQPTRRPGVSGDTLKTMPKKTHFV